VMKRYSRSGELATVALKVSILGLLPRTILSRLTCSAGRRLVADQIVCCGDLEPIARIAAYSLAAATNKTSRTTCSSPADVAARVGESHAEMVRGIRPLKEAGQLKTRRRDNGTVDKALLQGHILRFS
jgi:hypothetical protein